MYIALNYFENFFVFVSAVNSLVSISPFVSLVGGVPVGTTSSAVGLKIFVITTEIKKRKSITKKKKKRLNKIVLLAKSKLDTIEFLISKTSIDSYINHKEFSH